MSYKIMKNGLDEYWIERRYENGWIDITYYADGQLRRYFSTIDDAENHIAGLIQKAVEAERKALLRSQIVQVKIIEE
jgi:hypothetical protein